MSDLVDDLAAFIRRAPTPYHAVSEAARRLTSSGFRILDERDTSPLAPSERVVVVRNGGTLAAVVMGTASPADAGFRILGAHTDSPNLRLKPKPEIAEVGYHQIALEPYGGVLLYSWLDRDLSLAGRVVFSQEGVLRTILVDFERPLLHIPSLAIHLQREIREEGLKLNPQAHLSAIVGLGAGPPLRELLAERIRNETGFDVPGTDILGFDLMAYDTRGPERAGSAGEFFCSGRLDNLASCHAALTALIAAAQEPSTATRVIALYDHEEVGSRSSSGAAGPFLESVLNRACEAFRLGCGETSVALIRSRMISVDMAHAVHPNWPERHDRSHRPLLGGGPVLKTNVNQSYATDAGTAAAFAALCRECDVPLQHFVSRSDFVCGSTIGPTTATRTGIPVADVGNPMLAMHSCREIAGSSDIAPMIRVLTRFLSS